jgi:hypothetical protein
MIRAQPFSIIFDRFWFPSEDTVDGLLMRLDMGEEITL